MRVADDGFELQGAVAVVTGSTRGIGRETALALGRAGAAVVVTGRTTEDKPHQVLPGTLEGVRAELEAAGVDALAVQADLMDAAATARMIDEILAWRGRCDVLVNNAAYTSNGPVLDVPFGRWEKAFRVQVGTPLQLVQAFVPGMLERGSGRVVNISTGAATNVQPGLGLYSLTKAGNERLTVQLDLELARPGVTFNSLRIEIGVATETWNYVAETQGMDFVMDGGKVTDIGSPAAVGAQVAWLVRQPGDWSGHIVECREIPGLGGPEWR
jgi:NAD(P)-dependent dehydrogenase (short-subunit alcohol dehydrogenase family)